MNANFANGGVEKFGWEWCRRRRNPDVHILKMLQRRELGSRKSGTHLFNGAREFYQCVHPSKEIHGVEVELSIKKFSPDGQYLVCFRNDLHAVSVRNFVGLSTVAQTPSTSLFEKVFPELYCINVCVAAQEGTILNKDCVFITRDSRHLIVATEAQISETLPTISQIHSNNECLEPLSPQSLNTVCFLCIDLQHQTIHILDVEKQSGCLRLIKQLGRTLYEGDECVIGPTVNEKIFTGMKHRLLTFFYRSFLKQGKVDYFLKNFAYFCDLRIWQMQLVSPEIVLLRLVNEDAFASSATINAQPAFFVFMNWRTTDIITVFDCYSDYFLWIVENFYEEFKHPHILDNRFPITMQHCRFDLERHCRLKRYSGSKGSNAEVRKRILSQLPYSTAYASIETPYLDPVMFSYDDFLLSLVERMKLPPREKLRFFSRVISQPLFEMEINAGRSVQLLFHPHEPFAISFDRSLHNTTATFHVPHSAVQHK